MLLEVRTSRRRWWLRPTSRCTPLASTAKSMAVAGRWACCSSTRCPASRCHHPPTGAAAARVHLLRKHTLTKLSPLSRPCRRPRGPTRTLPPPWPVQQEGAPVTYRGAVRARTVSWESTTNKFATRHNVESHTQTHAPTTTKPTKRAA